MTIAKASQTFIVLSLLVLFSSCGDNGTDTSPIPEITSISPTIGPSGAIVTINGSGFSAIASENAVKFSGSVATVNTSTSSQIEAVVPAQATTGAVEVVVNGLVAVGPNFSVEIDAVGITGISPDSAREGDQIIINGMNFGNTPGGNVVTFNGGNIAEVSLANESQLTLTVPEGAKSGPILVTSGGQTVPSPKFTVIPGYQLAFLNNQTGNFGLWLIRTDGTDLRYLSGGVEEFDWSPDGSQLVIVSELFGYTQLWLLNVNGDSELINNTTGNERGAQWSPDGNVILHESDTDGFYDIWLIHKDGTNLVNLTNNASSDVNARWSPDGSKIAFVSDRTGNDDIWVMNNDGSNLVNLTNNTDTDTYPVWSPDGSRIAFNTTDENFNSIIKLMNNDGSNPVNLTPNSMNNYFPEWSPDGSKIAFRSSRAGLEEVWVMDSDGSNEFNLSQGNGLYPQWFQDGTKILFSSSRTTDSEIWMVDADGSNLKKITNNPGFFEFSAMWRPNQ